MSLALLDVLRPDALLARILTGLVLGSAARGVVGDEGVGRAGFHRRAYQVHFLDAKGLDGRELIRCKTSVYDDV